MKGDPSNTDRFVISLLTVRKEEKVFVLLLHIAM